MQCATVNLRASRGATYFQNESTEIERKKQSGMSQAKHCRKGYTIIEFK